MTKLILVTGGAGYIGGHCVLSLLENNYDVVVFDNLETGHIETIDTLKNENYQGKFKEFIKGDLRNFEEIAAVFKKHKFDAVVHFAAFSQVGESVKNPQKYYLNNVVGSLNLLNAMLNQNVKNIVFSSTAATYGEPVYTPIDEKHPQNPINPYGSTKLMVEKIMDDYDSAYGLKSVRLRYFNVAGANKKSLIGEWHEPETHLIPNILKAAFEESKTFNIFGNDYQTPDGTCIRDYIDIDDLVNAHLLALKYLEDGGATNYFNLGTKCGNSVREVFDICEQIISKKIPVNVQSRRDGDPAKLVADNEKAKKILGWEPQKTLRDSVESAYLWEKCAFNSEIK